MEAKRLLSAFAVCAAITIACALVLPLIGSADVNYAKLGPATCRITRFCSKSVCLGFCCRCWPAEHWRFRECCSSLCFATHLRRLTRLGLERRVLGRGDRHLHGFQTVWVSSMVGAGITLVIVLGVR